LKSSKNLLEATQKSINKFKGSFAVAVMSKDSPDEIVIAKKSAPMVIGLSDKGLFFASDKLALLELTSTFIYLEDDDIAHIEIDKLSIFDKSGKKVERDKVEIKLKPGQIDKGKFPHFMLKEIYEQPQSIRDTLESRISHNEIYIESFGHNAHEVFSKIDHVKIIACGTSYNAGLVTKFWLEDIAQISCSVEIASEYRYRNSITPKNTLFVTISQSGETADTLEALKNAKLKNPQSNTLTICNSPESSLTRESEIVFLTHAGPEIGVASTKAFTTQLVSLSLLTVCIGKAKKTIDSSQEEIIAKGLNRLPGLIEDALKHENIIKDIADEFSDKYNALFLGRGTMHAIAMEGALKLKEISYIHAEAFPAGELKHGPIALIDKKTPVIVVAPKDELLDKLNSNLQEVKSRGSQMYVFKDELADINIGENVQIIPITKGLGRITGPILFAIPLQLLSYFVALKKGCNIDQPRNLAKSVTVE
jgi:glucosamine--fructose-6-phosphate aminotransferase (isomerizing)